MAKKGFRQGTIFKQSLERDAADNQAHLVGDSAAPGNDKCYATDGAGVKGFRDFPTPPADSYTVKADAGDASPGFLDAKVQKSIEIDGTVDKLELVGDSASPGNNKAYGTNGSGVKGFRDFPATATNIKTFTWVVSAPAVGGIPGPRIKEAMSATRIDAYVTSATSATFNIEKRSTIGSSGTNLCTTDKAATTTGVSVTPDVTAVAADQWLWLDISAVSGTPAILVVTIAFTAP